MKKNILCLLLLAFSVYCSSQSISEIKLKSDINGKSKLKKAPKKFFIAEFRVMYQIMYVAEDTKKGSVFEGGMTGDVKVALAMGLSGLSENDLIENTNFLYQQYVNRMKDAGYQQVTASEIKSIKEFNGWELKQGGGLSNAQFKGFIMSTPTDFEYFVKGTKGDGREKKTFTDNSAKISYQGDKITVVKINLVLPMAENTESWASGAFDLGGAKVVASTSLRLSNEMISGKGFANTIYTGITYVNSEAMSLPTSMLVFNLKEDVDINGVLEKKKYKVTGSSDYDFSGSDMGLYRVFEVENKFMKKVIPIVVDPIKYNSGVRLACDSFLKKTQEEFLAN